MVKVGEKIPEFQLPRWKENKMEIISVPSTFQGEKTVLFFFPLAFSPVCTEEMCEVRDEFQEFARLDAVVYGISVDSPFVLEAFAHHHHIPFPLLSDFNKEIIKKFGVFHEEILGLKGVAKRSVFIVDSQGIVRYRWVSEDPRQKPDLAEVQRILSGIS
ncbi:MAG: redoxin domain-containing protein [bacterium]